MPEKSDPIAEIVPSRSEVADEDVEPLWSDLMAGRATARETAGRAQVLLETASATHVANWGLSGLYALTFRAVPAAEDVSAAHERWQRHVREYHADPGAWDRNYYQQMIIGFAQQHDTEAARSFGAKLVASGLLRDADVAAALARDPDLG